MIKKTILVASEDDSVTDCITAVLDEDEFSPIYVDRASEVLLEVLDVKLDLLILDIDLSGMSGLDFIRIIKKMRPKLPLIVISSDNSFETGKEVAKLGIELYLLKPIETDKLENFMNHVKIKSN